MDKTHDYHNWMQNVSDESMFLTEEIQKRKTTLGKILSKEHLRDANKLNVKLNLGKDSPDQN